MAETCSRCGYFSCKCGLESYEKYGYMKSPGEKRQDKIKQLQAENKRLKDALKKYGKHTKECSDEKYPEAWHCICGFAIALQEKSQ